LEVENLSHTTDFKNIPDEWTCPQCGEEKEGFIELEFPYAN